MSSEQQEAHLRSCREELALAMWNRRNHRPCTARLHLKMAKLFRRLAREEAEER